MPETLPAIFVSRSDPPGPNGGITFRLIAGLPLKAGSLCELAKMGGCREAGAMTSIKIDVVATILAERLTVTVTVSSPGCSAT